MHNESITLYVTRGGFLTLDAVETYIRQTTERFGTGDNLFLGGSSVRYHNGSWTANLEFTTRPNDDGFVEEDFGF